MGQTEAVGWPIDILLGSFQASSGGCQGNRRIIIFPIDSHTNGFVDWMESKNGLKVARNNHPWLIFIVLRSNWLIFTWHVDLVQGVDERCDQWSLAVVSDWLPTRMENALGFTSYKEVLF